MLDIGAAVDFFEGRVCSEVDVFSGWQWKGKDRGSIDALFLSLYLARVRNRGINLAVW